jgi:DNA repair protein RadA/Sms
MILAVLEARCGVSLANHDVYLNIAGGIKINEPAADLAVAGAIYSAKENIVFPLNTVSFGEISLSGAVRQVSQIESRLKEAEKLGFIEAITATRNKKTSSNGINVREINNLRGFISMMQKYRGSAKVSGDGRP